MSIKTVAFYDYVCVLFYETTNIPLELLIAAFTKKNCVLMKFVNNVQDAEIGNLGVNGKRK